jgi:DNA-directed RNA polymerase specialized sigma24 family protein
MDPTTNSHLIARIRTGDRDALAEFVHGYEPLIRARFREQFASHSRELFDTSDFFATVLRRVDALQAGGVTFATQPPAEMLRRIMLDAAADYSRALRSPGHEASDHIAYPRTPHPVAVPDTHDDTQMRDAVVARLGGVDGQIFRLRTEGAEHRIVASALGMSEAAVRMRWHRILTRIREMLHGQKPRGGHTRSDSTTSSEDAA